MKLQKNDIVKNTKNGKTYIVVWSGLSAGANTPEVTVRAYNDGNPSGRYFYSKPSNFEKVD